MEMKQFVHLEVEKEGKLFTFSMPFGVKLGMAYDAAFECLSKLVELSQDAHKQASPENWGKKSDASSEDAAVQE